MADKMATESEISNYFQNRQSKVWYDPLMGHFLYTASIYKQTLIFTTFGDDRKSEFKIAVV